MIQTFSICPYCQEHTIAINLDRREMVFSSGNGEKPCDHLAYATVVLDFGSWSKAWTWSRGQGALSGDREDDDLLEFMVNWACEGVNFGLDVLPSVEGAIVGNCWYPWSDVGFDRGIPDRHPWDLDGSLDGWGFYSPEPLALLEDARRCDRRLSTQPTAE